MQQTTRRIIQRVVQKSRRLGAVKRTMQDYFRLHGSKKTVNPKMADRFIRYATRQFEKDRCTKTVAEEIRRAHRHDVD